MKQMVGVFILLFVSFGAWAQDNNYWACSCKNLSYKINIDKKCSAGFIHDSKEKAVAYAKDKCGASCDPDCMHGEKSPSEWARWACSCSNLTYDENMRKKCSAGYVHKSLADAEAYAKKTCGDSCVPDCGYDQPRSGDSLERLERRLDNNSSGN